MSAKSKGDDPAVHFIRDGRFVCTASTAAPCRNYPGCECEEWDEELHGTPPTPGHEDVPHDECWMAPWFGAADLADSFTTDLLILTDDEFPDGPITVTWEHDYVTWEYADGRVPERKDDDDCVTTRCAPCTFLPVR